MRTHDLIIKCRASVWRVQSPGNEPARLREKRANAVCFQDLRRDYVFSTAGGVHVVSEDSGGSTGNAIACAARGVAAKASTGLISPELHVGVFGGKSISRLGHDANVSLSALKTKSASVFSVAHFIQARVFWGRQV